MRDEYCTTGMLGQAAAGGLGAAMAQEDCPRQSHVDRELSELERAASRIETALTCVTNKILPVLCGGTRNEIPNKELAEDVIAPLADRIRITRKRFDVIENHLCALADAIEL